MHQYTPVKNAVISCTYMDDIFLKIIRGEIPSEKVYEDEVTFAFLDIKPNNKGHVLVVPKESFRNVFDMPVETFAAMARSAQKIAVALRDTIGAEGVNITMNNEPAAGQEVFHAHMHVIPRFSGDHAFAKPRHLSYEDGEMKVFAEKIRKGLS